MSTDFRGDPSAALLEVLDPEQNSTFNDHYLDLDYDLVDVMFITTANYLHGIPIPLQDRMEIIQLPGYTEWEKVVDRRAVPDPEAEARTTASATSKLDFAEDVVRDVIHHYTKEAGVRNLEREIATVCRKIARDVVAKKLPRASRASRRSRSRPSACRATSARTGTATGGRRATTRSASSTAWRSRCTAATCWRPRSRSSPGKGKLMLTGKLGDVMQESAQAAMSYVRSRAPSLGLDRDDFYSRVDIHVHLPEGAIPKDGPSAGITMCTALVSALLRVPVRQRRRDDRRDHAARARAARSAASRRRSSRRTARASPR